MILAFLLGLGAGFVSSIPVAGPIALLVVAYGMSARMRAGIYVALGGAIAESGYAFVAFWGVSSLLGVHPLVVPITRGLGAVLLVALGIYLMRKPATAADTQGERDAREGGTFFIGFTITALNPTLLVTWTTAAAGLSSVDRDLLTRGHALPLAVGVFVGIVGWFAVLLGVLGHYRDRLGPNTLGNFVRGVGGALVLLGLWFGYKFVTYWAQGLHDRCLL